MVSFSYGAVMGLMLGMAFQFARGDTFEMNTDLGANGAFADLVTIKTSYYRALCDANPVTWDQGLADIASKKVSDCNLQYDYWFPEGQIIFRMVGEGNRIVNSPNATYFAIDHWYAMRVNYTDIQSDEYDELQPFYPAWEFTQMVWKANQKVGCAYATAAECPDIDASPNDKLYQLYCLFSPGGNKWDQWGANVECKDCKGVEPQKSTINTATLTFPSKRSVPSTTVTSSPAYDPPSESVKASLEAGLHRVAKYLEMSDEEFTARWDLPKNTAAPTATQSLGIIQENVKAQEVGV